MPQTVITPEVALGKTCGMLSVIATTEHNAFVDREAGTVSAEQYAALSASIHTGYRLVSQEEPQSVSAEVEAILAYFDGIEIQSFDMRNEEYRLLVQPLSDTCSAAGVPVAVFATSGG
ncbi:hypothetical protein [Okibacterium endophyticum]